ncbi:hypothetical protein [Pseudomonas syringae]|uniref:Aspartate/methionine/tyrosine aminotransferase n=1 Tax=Pseudomonas syringae pv. actinidiae TaxID=103796 RepID=A0AAN4Q2S1_PSESF|nr:hypothetical protein [Pseudomonas syringae]OSR36693.1 hypothetical protein BV322_03729 [Pseudomonas syringae pv. actinidiae]OSS01282.1 hypothetical protein BV332_03764 [Pseudomonas syringae pv. actinidiae]GBH16282.1 Aspartate/methionine/tyrosine aminotransferase [Pseudomonas syringae pv. actinidiae]
MDVYKAIYKTIEVQSLAPGALVIVQRSCPAASKRDRLRGVFKTTKYQCSFDIDSISVQRVDALRIVYDKISSNLNILQVNPARGFEAAIQRYRLGYYRIVHAQNIIYRSTKLTAAAS